MSKTSIQCNVSEIRIRPSSIDTFYNCSYQWAKVFLEGKSSIPNARAAIGTAIHKAAEVMWTEAIETRSKDTNLTKMREAALQEFDLVKHDLQFDDGEDENTAAVEIIKGTDTFVEDIAPFSEIPIAVEQYLEIAITGHPLVRAIGGTVDYITSSSIADLKTSKKKATVANYNTQQSTYKLLALENGYNIKHNLIQNVVLTKKAVGQILPMNVNMDQSKMMINRLLDTVELFTEDRVPSEILFRGNPKYYLCSEKYCAFYNDCPYVKGDLPVEQPKVVKL